MHHSIESSFQNHADQKKETLESSRGKPVHSLVIFIHLFFIVSRTSDRYPMSNLSDSEFLLNHSALINLEGDHRSMLLLGPATYRGPVVEVSR